MVINPVFQKRLLGSRTTPLPQDRIVIFLSDQRLQFVVADHLNKVHYISDFDCAGNLNATGLLQQVFSSDEIIRRSYLSTHLVLCHHQTILQPKPLLEQSLEMASFFLKPSVNQEIQSETVAHIESSLVFNMDTGLRAYAKQVLTNLQVHHLHSLLINWCYSLLQSTLDPSVYGIFIHGQLSLLYFNDGKIQYINRFQIKGDQDILYYILLVFDQFQLDVQQDRLLMLRVPQRIKDDILGKHITNIEELKSTTDNRELDPYYIHFSTVDLIASLASVQE